MATSSRCRACGSEKVVVIREEAILRSGVRELVGVTLHCENPKCRKSFDLTRGYGH
jgi:hypothetical protein